MTALVIGASAGVGRALSEALAARGYPLLLVARGSEDLNAEAAHLRLNYGVAVQTVAFDASAPEAFLEVLRVAAGRIAPIRCLLFPIGVSRADDCGLLPVDAARNLIDVNLLSVIAVVSDFLPDMLEANDGVIVGFGSVAAVRGRKTNVVYAAAKRGLESYFESIRYLAGSTGVRVQFYQLGYISTQQTFGKKLIFPPASPVAVAEVVVDNLTRDVGFVRFPRYWTAVGWLVRALPWRILQRVEF